MWQQAHRMIWEGTRYNWELEGHLGAWVVERSCACKRNVRWSGSMQRGDGGGSQERTKLPLAFLKLTLYCVYWALRLWLAWLISITQLAKFSTGSEPAMPSLLGSQGQRSAPRYRQVPCFSLPDRKGSCANHSGDRTRWRGPKQLQGWRDLAGVSRSLAQKSWHYWIQALGFVSSTATRWKKRISYGRTK